MIRKKAFEEQRDTSAHEIGHLLIGSKHPLSEDDDLAHLNKEWLIMGSSGGAPRIDVGRRIKGAIWFWITTRKGNILGDSNSRAILLLKRFSD